MLALSSGCAPRAIRGPRYAEDSTLSRDANLCVIDPLPSFLGATINGWNKQHVRRPVGATRECCILRMAGASSRNNTVAIVDLATRASYLRLRKYNAESLGCNARRNEDRGFCLWRGAAAEHTSQARNAKRP